MQGRGRVSVAGVDLPPPAMEHRIRRKFSDDPEDRSPKVVTQQAPNTSVNDGHTVRDDLPGVPAVPKPAVLCPSLSPELFIEHPEVSWT